MALTNNEAKIILGMILRGDKQHDIAAWFGENQARIVEVEKGSHGPLAPAPKSDLPPKGSPGPKGRRLRAFVAKALKALEDGSPSEATKILKSGVEAYDRNEA